MGLMIDLQPMQCLGCGKVGWVFAGPYTCMVCVDNPPERVDTGAATAASEDKCISSSLSQSLLVSSSSSACKSSTLEESSPDSSSSTSLTGQPCGQPYGNENEG